MSPARLGRQDKMGALGPDAPAETESVGRRARMVSGSGLRRVVCAEQALDLGAALPSLSRTTFSHGRSERRVG